jgi:hypothetical protein
VRKQSIVQVITTHFAGLAEDAAVVVTADLAGPLGHWPLLDCWQYYISQGRDAVIVTYGCPVISTDPPVVSHEHKRAGLSGPGEVPGLVMPEGRLRA